MEKKTKKKDKKPVKKNPNKEIDSGPSTSSNDYDALNGYSSIREWEDKKGRGFWGNSSSGYIYDKDL